MAKIVVFDSDEPGMFERGDVVGVLGDEVDLSGSKLGPPAFLVVEVDVHPADLAHLLEPEVTTVVLPSHQEVDLFSNQRLITAAGGLNALLARAVDIDNEAKRQHVAKLGGETRITKARKHRIALSDDERRPRSPRMTRSKLNERTSVKR